MNLNESDLYNVGYGAMFHRLLINNHEYYYGWYINGFAIRASPTVCVMNIEDVEKE